MIPKIIFIYWHNDDYPKIVKYNIKKIKKLHPDYTVNVLNRDTVNNFINIEKYSFKFSDKLLNTEAYFSDILRILLLAKYGGIWIDASFILWKRVDNIVKPHNKLVLIRNYNNDNGYNNKGFESWFIASIQNHPFITNIKKIIVSLNTYDKIKHFIRNRSFNFQKNTKEEYHLIYHIISYVQKKHTESLKDYVEYDSKLLYPNNYIPNIIDIPFTSINTYTFNFIPIFNFLSAKKIEGYIKYGEPEYIIGSKITSGIREYIHL